jgi:hypothetical protein
MSKIEERIWIELIGEPEAEQALLARQPPGEGRSSGRVAVFVVGALVLAAIVVLAVALTGGASTTPAYAVSVNPDGSVSLAIDEIVGVRGANEALARLGVKARVAQIEAGCRRTGKIDLNLIHDRRLIVEPRKVGGRGSPLEKEMRRREGARAFAGINVIIHADEIPRSDTLVISAELNRPVRYHGKEVPSISMSSGLFRRVPPTCSRPF